MAKRRVMLTYHPEISSEPIIYTLGQQFNLATNIHRADATESKGWIELELEGVDKDIEAGITWVISKGVRVDPVAAGE
ncbi:MAG TPA: NIL domain-containing protein [Dehalococcoidales bacterium]|nr:NIL domain-containing protein [Dehalococcoidales bacterium]